MIQVHFSDWKEGKLPLPLRCNSIVGAGKVDGIQLRWEDSLRFHQFTLNIIAKLVLRSQNGPKCSKLQRILSAVLVRLEHLADEVLLIHSLQQLFLGPEIYMVFT